ncbi:hypothetical protein FOZ63_002598 [Perkinsus olseni]|uniref:Uncharacterized protein n=1 Tax=Perkinsus olseni TaxID=32597 RepID=A0A7J6TDX5_PEROL|nr:hypothetical protein FOZ63_002598 [Perkinsus olseni]
MLMEHRLESTAIACIRDLDAPGAAPRGCVQYPRSGALVINPSYARRHADLIQSFGPRGERGPPLPAKARVFAAVSRYDADASSILRDVSDDILDDESSGDESDIRRVFDKTMIERVEAEVEEEERQAAAGASLMSSARESMSSESGGGSDGTSTETEESENSEFMRECEKSEERGPCDNSSSESDESESSEFIHESEISEEGSGCDNSSSESEGLLLEASAGSDSELEPDLEEGAAMGSRDTCHSIPDLGRKNIAVADKSYQSSPVPARSFDVHYCDADLGDGGNGAASIDVSPIEAAAISSPLIPTSNLWSPEQSPAPSVIHELSHANCSTEPWRPANLLMPRRSERIRKRPRIDYQMMHRRGLPR